MLDWRAMDSAKVTFGNQSFSAHPNGFRWEAVGGEVHEGPWSRLTSVTLLTTGLAVEGVKVGTWQHLYVTLDSGKAFRLQSRDAAAFEVARLTERFAGPLITRRVLQQLEAGQSVTFGPVTLSNQKLSYKSRSWPLAEVAGHRTAHGQWMLDVGPKDAPRLVAQVVLGNLPNHFALRAALERLKPGCEYPEGGPDLGTTMRPSASSHDPRGMTGRGRLFLIGGALGAAALVAAGILGTFALSGAADRRRVEEAKAQTAAKAQKVLAAAKALAIPETPLACADFPKDADAALFFVEAPAGVEHPYKGEPYHFDSTTLHEMYPFDSATHAVVARVLSVAPSAQEKHVDVKAAVAVFDFATAQLRCSGQVTRTAKVVWSPGPSLAAALATAVCPSSSAERACKRALSESTPLVQAEPKPEPGTEPPPAAPAAWATGQRIEVQRKGKWLPAVITQETKAGYRVHYEGQSAKLDEVVKPARMRRP